MPDEQLIERLVTAAEQVAQDSPSGEVDGETVVARLVLDIEEAELHYAFKVAEERGQIRVTQGWQGGMGIPYAVKVP